LSLLLLVGLALALASACTPAPAPGGQDRNFRTINVNGTGVVYGSPDIATADISVVTRDEDVKAASDENTRRMAAVIAALKGLGVEDNDFRTSNYNIFIDQPVGPEGEPVGPREYVITNTVTVTFRDLSVVGEGLQAAITAGANQVANINFALEDTSELAAQAREQAMADAQARADQLAQAAQVEIERPYNISESYSFIPQLRQAVGLGGGAIEAAAPVPVESGQIMVQVDVNVTYLIR
jgi:uncharacterized protein YggE